MGQRLVAVLAVAAVQALGVSPPGAVAGWQLRWVGDLDFSPDGRLLAVGTTEAVQLYESGTWKALRVLPFPGRQVSALAFSPDGALIAAGSWNEVRVWNTVTWDLTQAVQVQSGIVGALAFTTQGSLLIGGADGSLVLWDLAGGRALWVRAVHSVPVRAIAFSPDGALLATAGIDHALVREARTWELVHKIPGKAWDLCFTPDGHFLVLGWGKVVRLWDTAVWLLYREMWGHESCAVAIAVSPRGDLVASGSLDETVRVWDLESGECLAVLAGHEAAVKALRFSRDGAFLVTGGDNGSLFVWCLPAILPRRGSP